MIVQIGTTNIVHHQNGLQIPDGWAQAPELVFDADGMIDMRAIDEPPYLVPYTEQERVEKARASMIVSRLQARLALIQAGMWSAVELWAQDPDTPPEHLAFFADAATWQRNDATLSAAATALGLTDEQMDGLFALAATL